MNFAACVYANEAMLQIRCPESFKTFYNELLLCIVFAEQDDVLGVWHR